MGEEDGRQRDDEIRLAEIKGEERRHECEPEQPTTGPARVIFQEHGLHC